MAARDLAKNTGFSPRLIKVSEPVKYLYIDRPLHGFYSTTHQERVLYPQQQIIGLQAFQVRYCYKLQHIVVKCTMVLIP